MSVVSGGPATCSTVSAMASTGVASTTRKFSDKIKHMKTDEAKQTAEFEKIMNDMKDMKNKQVSSYAAVVF